MILDLNMQPVNEFISGLETGQHIILLPEIRKVKGVELDVLEARRMAVCLKNVVRTIAVHPTLCRLDKDNASPERAIAAVYALMDMARAALRLYDLTDKQMLLVVKALWVDADKNVKDRAAVAWFTEVKPA